MRAMDIRPGDPAPWFTARSTRAEAFHFSSAAGRYLVVCFLGSIAAPASRALLDEIVRHRHRFSDENALLCCVSADAADENRPLRPEPGSGVLYFWDEDAAVHALYGVAPAVAHEGDGESPPVTVVLDDGLRVLAVFREADGAATQASRILRFLESLPPVRERPGHAPILIVPHIFEPELCRQLIDLYEARGGEDSGFMRERDGKTVLVLDHGHKRRRDHQIENEPARKVTMARIHDRLVPAIDRAFQFRATRLERYIVSCYDATTQDHFKPHRDNTTKGTAHRRFAVTINLNSTAYEGGDLRFPEYGQRTYRSETGAALVFSCSILHEVLPMIRGRRFVFLPFLYDDAAADLRRENLHHLQL